MNHSGKLDHTRCIASVYAQWGMSHQCSFKRKVGDYCKIHDPVKVKARQDKTDAKHDAKYAIHSRDRDYRETLYEISTGEGYHSEIAKKVLEKYK